ARPPALVLQGLGQVPVVQGEPGHHLARQQLVDQAGVEVQALGVDRPPVRHDPRPGHREPVGPQVELVHQRHVRGVPVVVVAGDVAGVPVHHRAGRVREDVPDRVAAAVLVTGSLDLVGRGGAAPEEVGREGAWSGHCLTAPCMMPATSWRPATMNRTSSGIVARQAPARTREESTKWAACSCCNATGRVGSPGPRTRNGQKKSVQVATKVNRPSIAAAGRAAGTATCQKVRIIEQPSTRAASMSSSGIAWRRSCVIQHTPNALHRPGTMTATSSPVQPSLAITWNSGMTPSCTGTAIVAMTNTSSGPDPRNRSLAKAYPANVEKNTTEAATVVDTMSEFIVAFQKGTVSMTVAAFFRKLPPGTSGNGSRARIVESWLAMRKDHQMGNIEPSTTADRHP